MQLLSTSLVLLIYLFGIVASFKAPDVDSAPLPFDLFLPTHQLHRMLGVSAELFYVRNGKVNNYALAFKMPVPPTQEEVVFQWHMKLPQQVVYEISLNASDALREGASVNISLTGALPTSLKAFSVAMKCKTPSADSQSVEVGINISSIGFLQMQFQKSCLTSAVIGGDEKAAENINEDSWMNNGIMGIIYQGVCLAITTSVAFFCTLFTVWMVRRKHDLKLPHQSGQSEGGDTGGETKTVVTVTGCPPTPTTGTLDTARRPSLSQLSLLSPSSHISNPEVQEENLLAISIEPANLSIKETLLEGTFGRIARAQLNGNDVYIKALGDVASENQVTIFKKEGSRFLSLQHINLLVPEAAVLLPPILIYAWPEYGNLKKYLVELRSGGTEVGSTISSRCLSTLEVAILSLQYLSGVLYLHEQGFIHRDLATRNATLSDGPRVTVTDNALSRDLFPGDYHCLGDNENRPVKWLAYESLSHRKFTPLSDIWSYGVVVWEILTLAQQPYAELDPFEVKNVLKSGHRLSQPKNCPDQLYRLLTFCWSQKPEERPSGQQIRQCLLNFLQQLDKFV
ncbi:unnamed protein product [Darwinula stevensoni]|uniref:Uncharacterized protein n=1 Tax=Darwinula stevensoni TaxID=69355 RepID=A0A7R9FPZ8_9CRUS|nr:unnamed protein product [Darwinula stevensoni]CAG0898530.1 unnamed protein product [Darwinula stevensoni]